MAENKETKKLEKTESEKVTGGVSKVKVNIKIDDRIPIVAYGIPKPMWPPFRPRPFPPKPPKNTKEKLDAINQPEDSPDEKN